MNHYGSQALQHWRRYLPAQLTRIPDQEAFFTQLGATAEKEIDQAAEALAATEPPSDAYLEETARLATARKTAEMQVVRELILIDPEDQERIAQLLG